jgi:hypothetical protein
LCAAERAAGFGKSLQLYNRDEGAQKIDIHVPQHFCPFLYPRKLGVYELTDEKQYAAGILRRKTGIKTDIMTRDSAKPAVLKLFELIPAPETASRWQTFGPGNPPPNG